MVEKFKRPEGLYPIMHHNFFAKDVEGDELVEYYVQDLTEDKSDAAVDFYARYLSPECNLQTAVKIAEDPQSVAMLEIFNRRVIEEKLSLACFKMSTHELVGINLLSSMTRGIKENFNAPDPKVQLLIDIVGSVSSSVDIGELYDVDHHLTGLGLCVKSEYRGRGIATELLKARVPLLQALGLTATATLFSTIGAQVSAHKAGYEEVFAISYEKLQEKFPEADFSKVNTSHCKIMSLKI